MDIPREIFLRDVENTKGASKIPKLEVTLIQRLLITTPVVMER